MKVSLSWLKELVDFKLSAKELTDKLSLSSIGVKEQTESYLELDLTYNRGDLLSLRGIASEISAITNSDLKFQDQTLPKHDLPNTPVRLEDENLSTVQCVAKIEGLKVEKSPEEWVQKLNDCGIRTVNNIADVTNLTMLEYGQPLHSFDADTVADNLIEVRLAKDGEELKTLDNKLRKLTPEDIVLADTQKPLDVAGIMGGKDTEVKESTTAILLSASMFNPTMVRKTSKRLGLSSEASKRFEHGLTSTNLLQAFYTAIKMYKSLGGKLTAITLTGNLTDEVKTIKLTQQKVNSLIGVDISAEQVESSLTALGFKLASHLTSRNVVWDVTVPYWRLDIQIEEDLIEEAARMYGYEKIPPKELKGEVPLKLDQSFPKFIYDLKVSLTNAGLTEVQTYSFYSSQIIKNLKLKTENLVRIANPISSETEILRDQLWPNLLEVVAKNLRQGYKDIAIFEIGKVYSPQKSDLPKEKYHLSIALCNNSDNPIQELNQLIKGFSNFDLSKDGVLTKKEYFHPTRQTDWIAEIHPRFVNKFGIDQRMAFLEIEILS